MTGGRVNLVAGILIGAFAVLSWQSWNSGELVPRAVHRKLQEPTQPLLTLDNHPHMHVHMQRDGFYVKPGTEHILAVAKEDTIAGTDKVSTHNYQTIYAKHFELGPGRHRVHKMLEIGLGCDMYGNGRDKPAIGASARLWRKYFPTAEIWFAEYDAQCLVQQKEAIDKLNIKTVAGDQANPATLAEWVTQTGGNFDVIIDDGGHGNNQQWQSFLHLFQNALKPGGLYVIEDMNVGVLSNYDPNHPEVIMYDVMQQYMAQLVRRDCGDAYRDPASYPMFLRKPHYSILPGIKSIECSAEACTITKCFLEDDTCVLKYCSDLDAQANSPWPWKPEVRQGPAS